MEGLAQFNQCLVLNLGCASPLARSLVPLLPVAGHDRLFLPGTAYRLRFVGGMDCGTHLIAPILEPLRRVPGRRVFALRLCRENPGRHVLGEIAGLGNLLHYLASTLTPAGLPCPVLLERLFSRSETRLVGKEVVCTF